MKTLKRLVLVVALAAACVVPAMAQLQARVVIDSPPATIPSRDVYPATVFFHVYTPPPSASVPAPMYLVSWKIVCTDGLELNGSSDVDSAKERWQGWSTNIPNPRVLKSLTLTARVVAGDAPVTVTLIPPTP